jgi:hypothetical protein
MAIPDRVHELRPKDMMIPLASFQQFWRKAKEKTSCYPSPMSFATMKAGATNDVISQLDCNMTNIPLSSCYSPLRWHKLMDVMILKRSGLTDLNSLHTIVLFPVDCNYAFKHIGKQMMTIAEQAQSLAPEQYGSRKAHRAINLATNKTLTNDILRQLKHSCAICSNDAKSCYDLIGHTQAALAMQRNGVPKSAIDCLFSTLQNATHQVRTGYGDSTSYYGGLYWIIPMHGIGQGNGAGPAVWAVLSTPLLNLLPKLGFGCFLISPITNIQKNFVGYSIVDDTDLIHSNPLDTSYTEVIQKMQHSLDTWEGGLKATGGAIVPEKTFWHLIDFKISPGSWRYKSIQECPGSLYVQDINGVRQEIRRFEASHAETTLGVDLVLHHMENTQLPTASYQLVQKAM